MESKLTVQQLLEILRRFSFDCCFIEDSDGTIVFVSDSYQRITGHDPAKLIGEHSSILKKLGIVDEPVGNLVAKDGTPMTTTMDYKNGKDIIATVIPVCDQTGRRQAIIGNIRDMTELNQLKRKVEQSRLKSRHLLQELKLQSFSRKGFIASSPEMQNLFSLAGRIAKVSSTVLITGESGVGKDVYAQLIQDMTQEVVGHKIPYMKVSCGAIPENLLESELFGYEYGAFTGAKKEGKPGIFELAGDGIVFLDEVGELPLTLQVKLLTVLQDREFTRLGGVKPISMRARLIAATNRDLERAVSEKSFREDLYYRLNVIPIYIPPLRERHEDVAPLILLYVQKFNEKYHLSRCLSPQVLRMLEAYQWPGNVRELSNVIERLIVLSPSDIVTEEMLPESITKSKDTNERELMDQELPLAEFLAKMEKFRITKALNKGMTLKETAEELGIDLSTLTRKIQKLELPRRNRHKYLHTDLPTQYL